MSLFTPIILASEITLYVEKFPIATLQIHVENTGQSKVIIVIKSLEHGHTAGKTIISPPRYIWHRNGQRQYLKDSLSRYGPVTLLPGEVTFIENPQISTNSGKILYKVKQQWADLHGVWAGSVEVSY